MPWGNPETKTEKALVKMLWPASFGLGTASYVRMMAYNVGLLKQQNIKALVVSIGNLTCGGTGKTPVTIDLAQRLVVRGRKLAILSRGYKRTSKAPVVVVSDGRQRLSSCSDAGDEPYLLSTMVPSAVVIVGAKRADTARLAADKFGCDTILLDDGFQHFGVARDIDIVLIDYNDELENDHLMPAGRLREPLSALARAKWVVITKVPEHPDEQKLKRVHELISRYAPGAAVTSCKMVANALHPFGCPDVTLSAATLKDTRVLAFCGIARPETFANQLKAMGADVVSFQPFPDHHWYTDKDIQAIADELARSNAEMVITTEKDSVKLLADRVKKLPLATLRQKVEWLGPIPIVGQLKQQGQVLRTP